MSATIDVLNVSIVRLDDSPTDHNETLAAEQQLRLLDSNLKIYRNITECKDYIESQPQDTRIALIVNGRLGQQIVPTVHTLPQIASIYVYCINKDAHQKWATGYPKVKAVLVDFNELKEQIRQNHVSQSNPVITEPSPTDNFKNPSTTTEVPPNVDSQTNNGQISPTYEMDCSYLISESCFDYLIRMKSTATDENEFFSFCQTALQGQDQKLPLLSQFKENYSSPLAISWLLKDPFFREMVTDMFNLIQIDAMFACRVFIRDVHKQLEQHKCTSTIRVYRGEIMQNKQFQELKNLNGKIIKMKSFFTATTDQDIAVVYTYSDVHSSNEYKRVLFNIEADPQIKDIKPFANIGTLSDDSDQSDVLFMIGSLFKIVEIEDEKDGLITIKMALCANDDSSKLKSCFNQSKCQYMDSNGETDLIGFSELLCQIGQSLRDSNILNAGEAYIRKYFAELSNDHLDRYRYYDALGSIDYYKGNLDSSLDFYKKSFNIKKEKLQPNDPKLAESYQNIALIYAQKGDNKLALENYQQLLLFYKKIHGDEHNDLAVCYTNMATIHEAEGRLPEAMSLYYQALAIMTKLDSKDKASFAAVYSNLGNLHSYLKHFDLALGYHNASLRIKLKLYAPIHPYIAATYRNIGLVHSYMTNVIQSRENFEKAAVIYRQIYETTNPIVMEIEELIKNPPTHQENTT